MTVGDRSHGLDIRIPSPARMYDYYLGGNHHFAADREAAQQVLAAVPQLREAAQANRAFGRDVVLHLLDQGIRQFLDVGCGMPTIGAIHDLIEGVEPPARVVYVDTDPVAVEHAISVLAGNRHATVIRADLRHPAGIVSHHNTRQLLDFRQPIAVLMLAVLPFIPDDEAYPAVAQLVDWLPAGSHIAVSHPDVDAWSVEAVTTVTEVYWRTSGPIRAWRDRAAIGRFFGGLDLVGPGLVGVTRWHPGAATEAAEDQPRAVALLGGVACKSPTGR